MSNKGQLRTRLLDSEAALMTVPADAAGILLPVLSVLPYAAMLVEKKSGRLLAWNPAFSAICPIPPLSGNPLESCGFAVSIATLLQKASEVNQLEWFSCEGMSSLAKQVCSSDNYAILGVTTCSSWLSSVAVGSVENLFDSFPGMIMLYSRDSILLACNKTYCDALGSRRRDILGQRLGSIVDGESAVRLQEAVATCAKTVEPQDVVTKAIIKQQVRWYQISMIPVPANAGQEYNVLCLCTDITAYRTLEDAVSKRDQLLYGTNAVAQLLLSSQGNFDECVNKVLDLLGQITGADRVYVWSIHDSPHPEINPELHTTQLYEWAPGVESQQDTEICTNRPISETIPTWIDIFLSGHCVNTIVKNMPREEREQLEPQGIISILTAPIFFHGELWGFIGFDDCHSEHIWSPSEENILMAAGSLIGAAIYNSRTTEALKESEMRLTMAAEATGEIIWSLDESYCLDHVSDKSTAVLGYRPEELLGRHYSILCPPTKGFEPSPAQPILHESTVQVRKKDGNLCWLQSSCIFVFDDKGDCVKAVGTSRDVTEVRLAHKQIQLAKEELEEANEKLRVAAQVANRLAEEANMANQAKGDFLTNMSHELRTPMNAIMGMVHLLGKTSLNQQQQSYLGNVRTASESLLQVINDIIDFSRITSESADLDTSVFPLEQVVFKALDVPRAKAAMMNLDFFTFINASLQDRFFTGDPERLGKVLRILADNAVKFTPKGTVKVSVFMDSATETTANLHFTVADTGIGLSDHEQKRLFSAFMQADTSSTRKFGGTGMGLALSHKLVTIMGGSIWCESVVGSGATFHVTLSLPFASNPAPEKINPYLHGDIGLSIAEEEDFEDLTEEERLERKLKGHSVLLVEDNEINQIVAQEILVQAGLEVTIASNGVEALEILKNNQFDTILMDIQMPEMDGLTASRAIRSQHQFNSLPIIALTAHARPEDRRLALDAGMNAHITKPIDPVALLRSIAERLE